MILDRQFAWLEQAALGLLLLAHGLAYCALWNLALTSPTLAEFLRDGIVFSQVGLAAIWIVFGPKPPALTVVTVLSLLAGCVLLWSTWSGLEGRVVYLVSVVEFGVIFVPLAAAWWRGVRVDRAAVIRPLGFKYQFSLRSLFLLTVVVALAARPLFRLHANMMATKTLATAPAVCIMALPAAAAALLMFWAVLSPGCCLIRLGVAILAQVFCAAVALLLGGRDADWWQMTLWLAPQGAIVGGSLAVLRGCGYRVGRDSRTVQTSVRWVSTREIERTRQFVERLN